MPTSERIKVWQEGFDEITDQFFARFGGLSERDLKWKPDSQSWSIAQIIDHLIVINSSYFEVFREIEQNNYRMPLWGHLSFLVAFFGRLVSQSVQPDRRKKIKTFSIWEPQQSQISDEILNRFREHQSLLKAHVSSFAKAIEQGKVIASPANKFVVYKLETAVDILLAHEKRHFQQAVEIMDLMNEMRDGAPSVSDQKDREA